MDNLPPNHYPNAPAPQQQPTQSPPQQHYYPPPPEPPQKHRRRRETLRSALSTIGILISAPLVALFLIAFVFQSYEVDGPSMENTLSHNDRLIVVKAGVTWANLRGQDYLPDRGDIIIFAKRGTIDPSIGGERQLIKRVIGLPGDQIIIENGIITIVNDERPNGFNPDEELGYGDLLASLDDSRDYNVTITEDEIFVMGDNRANSLDSRKFGAINADEVVGQLSVRIFPLDTITRF